MISTQPSVWRLCVETLGTEIARRKPAITNLTPN
nr:MAG TPA: hypothetical protein [Caudoviricetes sp.]